MEKKDIDFVGLFIDGFTLRKVNEFYRRYHLKKSEIHFSRFRRWCFEEALNRLNLGEKFSTEAHYYHPFEDPRVMHGSCRHERTLLFERRLQEARIQVHYNIPSPLYLGKPNMDLMEDIFLFTSYRRFRAVILVTTQGQYVPVLSKLHSMKIPSLLIGWNFEYPGKGRTVQWRTDTALQKKCTRYIDAAAGTDFRIFG